MLKSQIRKRLKCILVVFSVSSFLVGGSLTSAQTTDNWIGGTGVWSDGTNWDGGVPVTGENIVIGTASANSTDDFSLGIGTLTLSNAADTLTLIDGVTLTVGGAINNAGTISLASSNTATSVQLEISGSQTLSGKGTLLMSGTNANFIVAANTTDILTNASTIAGRGNIGNASMGFVNSGTVNASDVNGLFLNVSSAGLNNTGTLEATGGTLDIQGPAGSFLNYNSTTNTLTGGTYTANGGSITFAGSSMGITTLSARVTQEAGGQLFNLTSGANAFANLRSITATGVLTTNVGFTQPNQFSMAGALNILPNTVVNVGSLFQIKNNALTGGQWVLDSNLNITKTAANILTNSATLTLSGGTFFNTADGTNAFANLNANKKTLRILNFAHFTTAGTLTNTGQLTVAKGSKLTIGGSGTSYSQPSGKTTMDGMLIGATNIAGGTFLGAGSITGNVTLGSTTAATLSLGDAGKSAQVKVTGTYTQNSTGTLSVAIGGTTVGTQYSQLKVIGPANLSGTLAAPLIGAFTPTVGQTYAVVSATTVAGAFSNVTIPINSTEHFAISYTPTSAVLTVASGPARF